MDDRFPAAKNRWRAAGPGRQRRFGVQFPANVGIRQITTQSGQIYRRKPVFNLSKSAIRIPRRIHTPWTRSRLRRQAVADQLEPNRYQPFRHGGVGTYGLDEWLARSSRNAATSPSTIASRVGCSFGSQRGECRSATTPWSRSCSGSEAPMCRRTAFTPARP
jgi:hypothetical protein